MGSMLISQCKCGFESDCLSVGGGMMLYLHEKCWIPCFCDECELVMTINILTKEGKKGYYRCPKCRKTVKSYGEIGEDNFESQDEYIFDWGIDDEKRYFLQNKPYYCPKCKKEEMRFYSTGCWD
jgi:DNA-directed RNA polymerase subunit M/transcription elongation factor TFIIS